MRRLYPTLPPEKLSKGTNDHHTVAEMVVLYDLWECAHTLSWPVAGGEVNTRLTAMMVDREEMAWVVAAAVL